VNATHYTFSGEKTPAASQPMRTRSRPAGSVMQEHLRSLGMTSEPTGERSLAEAAMINCDAFAG